jgi:hypothetical protein
MHMHVAELRLSQTDSTRVTCDSELVAMPHDCIPRDSFASRVRQAHVIELLKARLKEAEDARKAAEDARKAAEDALVHAAAHPRL